MCQALPERKAVAKTCSSVANTCSPFLLQRTCVEPNTAILFCLPILPTPGLDVRLSIFYKLAHQLGTPFNYSTDRRTNYSKNAGLFDLKYKYSSSKQVT